MKIYRIDQNNRKRVQNFLVISFFLLIVLDAVLAFVSSPFPTFSRLFISATPEYYFIIVFLGIVTVNFFYPIYDRTERVSKITSSFILITIFTFLILTGQKIKKTPIECDSLVQYNSSKLFKKICYKKSDILDEDSNELDHSADKIDCPEKQEECDVFTGMGKVDFKGWVKMLFFFFGTFLGFLFWPQFKQKKQIF